MEPSVEYTQGYNAFTAHQEADANPYPKDSQQHADWRAGYQRALRDDAAVW